MATGYAMRRYDRKRLSFHNLNGYTYFFAGVVKPPATTSLHISVSTLVIWGMRDPVMRPSQLNGLEQYAPHVQVVRIDDAGHYPMRSHPTLVNQTIREFLRVGDR
jgi:pimeloyl-ACP methyl ester carboxylesterase